MGVDPKQLQERFNKKGNQRGDRMKLEDGENYLRLLPPTMEYLKESVDYISVDYLIHYRLGYEGNYQHEVCPRTNGKQNRCPVCEAVNKLYATKDASDKELAGRIRAKTRYCFNVLDLNNLEKGVQILEQGSQIYTEILKFIANPKYSDILDLDKGRNVTITKIPEKESPSGFVKYEFIPDPDVTSVRDKLPKNWKEQVSKLKESVDKPKSYDELRKILEGEPVEQEIEDEPESEPDQEPDDVEETKVEEKKSTKETGSSDHPFANLPDGEKPDCFGEEFGPKRDICIPCPFKVDCREEYLNVD